MIPSSFFATAPKHLESLLAEELRQLRLEQVRESRGGAAFTAPLIDAYRVCLWSRVAHSVLGVLACFPAPDPQALYAGVRDIAWDAHFGVSETFAVDCHVSQSTIRHSRFGAQKVKDAIVDQFRESSGQRPSVSVGHPDVRLNLHLHRDIATISIDLAGDSLHRRGYRMEQGPAPLRETLAAALLLRAGWPAIAERGGSFLDPMCGAGTLPIEAALIAADIAPGLARHRWGFTSWKLHDAAGWRRLQEDALQRRERGLVRIPQIRGCDRDLRMARIARANAFRAGLSDVVVIDRRDIRECRPSPADRPGLIVTNPPYGTRLGEAGELQSLYATLGGVLKARFPGWRAAVFTGNPELSRYLGLRIVRKHSIYNGPIAGKLLHLDIVTEGVAAQGSSARPMGTHERSAGAAMFANRLRKNQKHLARWRERNNVSCYRLYDADMPEYAMAVDVYEGEQRWVNVQEYAAPKSIEAVTARLRLREALDVMIEVLELNPQNLFYKVRRRQKGRAQYEKLRDRARVHEVREGDARFLVNFEDYLDTGLFLDHRATRQRLAQLASGQRFLNLFAYTGTATVYAAKGGALATTTVDMSRTYLDWAKRNMALNGFTGPEHEYIRADCLTWLRTDAPGREYGVIFLDPPTFSTSRRMHETFDVQRDHVQLIRSAARLLAGDGVLVFSNNSRRFQLDQASLGEFAVKDITRATIPKDFERTPDIHRCWEIRIRGH